MKRGLVVEGLHKSFGAHVVLDGLDLVVEPGAITAVLGPSGCGKTTLLRIVAGFLEPDSGSVSFDGRALVGPGVSVAPQHRGIGYVPQEGALFPHLSVAGNLAFGLPRARRRRFEVADLLDLVGLSSGLADRYPHELSGGQQQRVALARALAPDPVAVLLDEPFSSLDAGLRVETGRAVTRALRAADVTAVLVTHDQDEALALADQVAVVRDGRVVQVASPAQVYHTPVDPQVAAFVGSVVALPARVEGTLVRSALGTVDVGDEALQGDCTLLVRPEHLSIGDPGAGEVKAQVVDVSFFGHDALVRLELGTDAVAVTARVAGASVPEPGDTVGVRISGPVQLHR